MPGSLSCAHCVFNPLSSACKPPGFPLFSALLGSTPHSSSGCHCISPAGSFARTYPALCASYCRSGGDMPGISNAEVNAPPQTLGCPGRVAGRQGALPRSLCTCAPLMRLLLESGCGALFTRCSAVTVYWMDAQGVVRQYHGHVRRQAKREARAGCATGLHAVQCGRGERCNVALQNMYGGVEGGL